MPERLPPRLGIPQALANLDLLAYPAGATLLFVAGAALIAAAGWLAVRGFVLDRRTSPR